MMTLGIVTGAINACIRLISEDVIYIGILVLFVLGIIFCVLPVIRNGFQISRAAKQVKAESKNVLQKQLFRNKWLNSCWNNYRTNSESVSKNGVNCEITDFFNDRTVIGIPEKSQLSDILPGIFTSLGILGTFIGLTRGISGIDASTSANMQSSINHLLSGMDVAFRTSIFGVLFSIAYNILRRVTNSFAKTALRIFVQNCETNLYSPITSDNEALSLLNQILDSQNCLAEKIGNELVEALHSEINPAFGRLEEAFAGYSSSAEKRQNEGVSLMLDSFTEKMNISMKQQIEDLSTAIGQTIEMQTRQTEVQQGLQDILQRSMQELKQKMEDALSIEAVYRETIDAFKQNADSTQALQLTMQQTYEESGNQYRELMEQHSQQEIGMKKSITQLEAQMTTFSQGIEHLAGQIQVMLESSESKTAETYKQLTEFTQTLTAEIEAGMQQISDAMQGGTDQMTSRMSEMIRSNQTQLTGMLADMGSQSQNLTAGIQEYSLKLKQLFSEGAAQMAEQLNEKLEESLKQNREIQSSLESNLGTLLARLELISGELANTQHMAAESLDSSSTKLTVSVDGFADSIAQGLQQSFTVFDKAMSDAVEHLQQVLDGMQESIDDIPKGLHEQTRRFTDQLSRVSEIFAEYTQKHSNQLSPEKPGNAKNIYQKR